MLWQSELPNLARCTRDIPQVRFAHRELPGRIRRLHSDLHPGRLVQRSETRFSREDQRVQCQQIRGAESAMSRNGKAAFQTTRESVASPSLIVNTAERPHNKAVNSRGGYRRMGPLAMGIGKGVGDGFWKNGPRHPSPPIQVLHNPLNEEESTDAFVLPQRLTLEE